VLIDMHATTNSSGSTNFFIDSLKLEATVCR
jgi:hypothetical protein